MPVDRMQWGAEAWQFADLHMPDEPSPFQNDHGVPCVMLIHGGFWKKEYTLELMQPIANALSDAGVAAWNIEFKRWDDGDEGVWMDTLSDVLRAWGQLALLPGIDVTRSMVMGHSAGGHLVARMLARGMLPETVAGRLSHVMPISPLSDLRPLLQTSMNADLKLEAAEAVAESPIFMEDRVECPVTVWVGSAERPAFLDQARWLSEAWECGLVNDAGKHHFDVVDGLADAESEMLRILLG